MAGPKGPMIVILVRHADRAPAPADVESEKLIEIAFAGGRPITAGDQLCLRQVK
jgi:hypothetical protein